ncbi:hypothetical protein AAMO2058_001597200 [Amorphochlora amoebiformis]|mmetsp:Transcript_8412/g.13156  ORF Transcript_8412/g.13156 Transcript_8412/m.13156 type:complete len:625 (-) Transcript_8412:104-1978(-)
MDSENRIQGRRNTTYRKRNGNICSGSSRRCQRRLIYLGKKALLATCLIVLTGVYQSPDSFKLGESFAELKEDESTSMGDPEFYIHPSPAEIMQTVRDNSRENRYNDKPKTMKEKQERQYELMLCSHHYLNGRKIATVAGSDVRGLADGRARKSQFRSPTHMTFARDGTLYISDSGNFRIRVLTPGGEVTSLTQGTHHGYRDGPCRVALFNIIHGIALSPNQKALFVADQDNYVIRKIDLTSQEVTTFAGTPGKSEWRDGEPSEAMFVSPRDLIVANDSSVYVSDSENFRIRKLDPDGYVTTIAGSGFDEDLILSDGPGMYAHFYFPLGLALDAKQRLYVADFPTGLIRRVTARGRVSTYAGNRALMIDPDNGNLKHKIEHLVSFQQHVPTRDWKELGLKWSYKAKPPYMPGACAVCLDPHGNLYVADRKRRVIFQIPKTKQHPHIPEIYAGNSEQLSRSINGPARTAQLLMPVDLAWHPTEDVLYLVDQLDHQIKKVCVGSFEECKVRENPREPPDPLYTSEDDTNLKYGHIRLRDVPVDKLDLFSKMKSEAIKKFKRRQIRAWNRLPAYAKQIYVLNENSPLPICDEDGRKLIQHRDMNGRRRQPRSTPRRPWDSGGAPADPD